MPGALVRLWIRERFTPRPVCPTYLASVRIYWMCVRLLLHTATTTKATWCARSGRVMWCRIGGSCARMADCVCVCGSSVFVLGGGLMLGVHVISENGELVVCLLCEMVSLWWCARKIVLRADSRRRRRRCFVGFWVTVVGIVYGGVCMHCQTADFGWHIHANMLTHSLTCYTHTQTGIFMLYARVKRKLYGLAKCVEWFRANVYIYTYLQGSCAKVYKWNANTCII